jgi:hypothetical protein
MVRMSNENASWLDYVMVLVPAVIVLTAMSLWVH